MAHNLNYNEKIQRHAFFGVKEPAWHGLGKIVDNMLTSEEAIIAAGLDYEVVKVPNFAAIPIDFDYPDDEQDFVKSEGSYSTVRTDTRDIIGLVGNNYTIVQNKDAFTWFDDLVKAKEAMFTTAGAIGKGERIFITAKLPGYIRIGNSDDVIEQYLLLFNSHDGTKAVEVMFTPVRVVCNNTLTYAMNTATVKYRIRHTNNVKSKLDLAAKVLNINNMLVEKASDVYNKMAKFKLSNNDVRAYLSKVFLTDAEMEDMKLGADMRDVVTQRKRNTLADIFLYYFEGNGQNTNEAKGTLWGAFNAITGYYQNSYNFHNDSSKMHSITHGNVLTKTALAYKVANDFISAGEVVV